MIATNKYVEYWKQAILSILDKTSEPGNIEFYLFTDQKDQMVAWANALNMGLKLTVKEIPNYVWPDATLKRYEIINQHISIFSNKFLFYLDVDMVLNADLFLSLQPYLVESKLNFVLHPGFVVGARFPQKFHLVRRPRILLSILKNGGSAGDWETNSFSTAYVCKEERQFYLHGAFWGGDKESFFKMTKYCARQVELDLQNKVVAKWHDESHLNKYFAKFGGNVLPSEFSWYEPYRSWLPKGWIIASVNTFGKTR